MRPKKSLDLKEVEKLMQFRPSLEETAQWFGVSPDTISRRIQEEFGLSFADFKYKRGFGLRKKLQEKAISMALSGDRTMLIFALKNLAGWGDKPIEPLQEIDDVIFVDE